MFSSGSRLLHAVGRTLVLGAIALAPTAPGAEVAGTLPEDHLPALREILRAARSQSPQTLAAEIEIALGEARQQIADAPRRPQVHADIYLAPNQTSVSGGSGSRSRDEGFFYNVALNQTLFQWGALKNRSSIARISSEIARHNHREAYRLLTLNLRQLYLALVVGRATLAQARFAVDLLEQDLRVEREKFDRGLVSRGTVAQREIGLRESRLYVTRLEADFAADRHRLARIAGLDGLAEDTVPTEIPALEAAPALAAWLVAGLRRDGARSTFEARVAEMRIREAELRLEIERVRLRPRIYVAAATTLENATTATPDTVVQQGVTRHSFSLNAQWPIFDGHAARGARLEAVALRRQQERQLASVTAEVIERAQTLERRLAVDAEALAISEIYRENAAAGLRHVADEFERGNRPQNAVAAARSSLMQREAATAAARATYLSHWSDLVSLAGVDPPAGNVSSPQ